MNSLPRPEGLVSYPGGFIAFGKKYFYLNPGIMFIRLWKESTS